MNWIVVSDAEVIGAPEVRHATLVYFTCMFIGWCAWRGGGMEWINEPIFYRRRFRFVPSMGATIH